MAFDAAASGAKRGPATAAHNDDASSAVSVLSQKVWNLVQTKTSIDNLSNAIGGPSDTTTLRNKLLAAETQAQSLQNEIELGLRRLRVSTVAKAGDASSANTQRQMKRLEEQYSEVKDSLAATVAGSRLKRRQFQPSAAPANETVTGGARSAQGGPGAGAGGGGRPGGARQGQDVEMTAIQIEMQNFSEVDAAIVEERNAEALTIAKESAALGRMAQDLNTLVVEQGETLAVVEQNVDSALDRTKGAVTELTQAQTLQRSYRCKCAMFWLLAAIAAALIAIPLLVHYVPQQQQKKD